MTTKLAASLGALTIAIPVAQAAGATRAQAKTVAKKTVTRKVSGPRGRTLTVGERCRSS